MKYQNAKPAYQQTDKHNKMKNVLATIFCHKKEGLIELAEVLEYNYEVITNELEQMKKQANRECFQDRCTNHLYVQSLKQRSVKMLNSINSIRKKILLINAIEKQA